MAAPLTSFSVACRARTLGARGEPAVQILGEFLVPESPCAPSRRARDGVGAGPQPPDRSGTARPGRTAFPGADLRHAHALVFLVAGLRARRLRELTPVGTTPRLLATRHLGPAPASVAPAPAPQPPRRLGCKSRELRAGGPRPRAAGSGPHTSSARRPPVHSRRPRRLGPPWTRLKLGTSPLLPTSTTARPRW